MRRLSGLILLVAVLALLVAPLVRGAQAPCGMCASACCCQPPGGGRGERPSVRLVMACPGSGSAESAVPALWRPASLPEAPVLREPRESRPVVPPSAPPPRAALPEPPTPPPRTV